MITEEDRYRLFAQFGERDMVMREYLMLKSWPPVMAALLACGIRAPIGGDRIPLGGVGLEGVDLHASNGRFHEARSILRKWNDWKESEEGQGEVIAEEIQLYDFFMWCEDTNIDTQWLRQFRFLAGIPIEGHIEASPSPLHILAGASSIRQGLATTSENNKMANTSVLVHKIETRVNALTTAIEEAIKRAGNDNAADVFVQLSHMAKAKHTPFTGAEKGELFYTDGAGSGILNRSRLDSRLSRRRKSLAVVSNR